MTQENSFAQLGLSPVIVNALIKKGYKEPTEIQQKAIPILLGQEFDIVAQAQTGTGKTAGFALPIVDLIEHKGHVQAIVLVPTRELAMQVAKEFQSFCGEKNLRVLAVYGGASIRDQITALRSGVDIVVGTPGRVMDMLERKDLKLANISYAVLDEADEMLNMGFLESIEEILKRTNPTKKTFLFSATMPPPILKIAKRFMHKYQIVKVEPTAVLIDHVVYEVDQRYDALRRIIAANPDFYGIVFCRTKADVDALSSKLAGEYPSDALHGDITQAQREAILNKFRKKILKILVATDVAARGIDVDDLTHVVNYSLPQSPETYTHRVGRTGRAGKKGIAITLINPAERRKLRAIEHIIGKRLQTGELPDREEILALKKQHIVEVVRNIIYAGKTHDFDALTKELLANDDAEKVVSAVLKYAFANELAKAAPKHSEKDVGASTPQKPFDRKSRGRDRGQRRDGSRSHSRDGNKSGGFRRDGPRREGGNREGGNRDGPRREGGNREGSRFDSGPRKFAKRSGSRNFSRR